MSESNLDFEQELHQRIDEVLHYVWDPVGIAREPLARDEYFDIVPDVFALLVEDADEHRVMEFLLRVETDYLRVGPRPSHTKRVAELLVDWRAVLEHKYGGGPA